VKPLLSGELDQIDDVTALLGGLIHLAAKMSRIDEGIETDFGQDVGTLDRRVRWRVMHDLRREVVGREFVAIDHFPDRTGRTRRWSARARAGQDHAKSRRFRCRDDFLFHSSKMNMSPAAPSIWVSKHSVSAISYFRFGDAKKCPRHAKAQCAAHEGVTACGNAPKQNAHAVAYLNAEFIDGALKSIAQTSSSAPCNPRSTTVGVCSARLVVDARRAYCDPRVERDLQCIPSVSYNCASARQRTLMGYSCADSQSLLRARGLGHSRV